MNKETERVAISSVVLSGQLVPMADAIYNAQKGKQQEKNIAVDPLIVNGAKLVASVTRVFSRSKPLYVFLQAYEAAASTPRPLIGYLSLYKDNMLVERSEAVSASAPNTTRLTALPVSLALDIARLVPGQYECHMCRAAPPQQQTLRKAARPGAAGHRGYETPD